MSVSDAPFAQANGKNWSAQTLLFDRPAGVRAPAGRFISCRASRPTPKMRLYLIFSASICATDLVGQQATGDGTGDLITLVGKGADLASRQVRNIHVS